MDPLVLRASGSNKLIFFALLILWNLAVVLGHAQAVPVAGNAPATFSIEDNHLQVASLDGLWRFHTGDDPRWANPDFDDSQWPLLRSDTSWTKQGFAGYSGYAWYRFQLEIDDGARPLSLLLPTLETGYQVYANGRMIGSSGSASPTLDPKISRIATNFRVPTRGPGPQTIHFALRVWEYRPFVDWVGGGPRNEGSAAGDPKVLARRLRGDLNALTLNYVNEYAYGLLVLVAGLTVLGLYLFHPADREYLWFSILLLANAVQAAIHMWMNLGDLPFPLWRQLNLFTYAISTISALNFFAVVLRNRRSVLWWIACCATAAGTLTAPLIYFQWTGIGVSYAIDVLCDLPGSIWIVATLALCAVKKDATARLLVVPAGLYYSIDLLTHISRILWQITGNGKFFIGTISLADRPFPLGLEDVVGYIFVLALLIFLVRRFSLARQKETRLSNEMEAARSIQSVLFPEAAPNTPRFAVENIYLPANEVGGDFFQILPHANDESLLIVAGDVTGKGLQAGMLVALLVGAIRSVAEETTEPLKILQALNRRLLGRGDAKATCLAVRIAADGAAMLANAGHLPPYLNGKPVEMEGALPLGMIDGAEFSVMQFELTEGDRLVFISDGIAEATDAKGQLFGFERVNELLSSPKSAAEVAAAAQAFGHEDDISVICVTRTGVLETAIA